MAPFYYFPWKWQALLGAVLIFDLALILQIKYKNKNNKMLTILGKTDD